MRGRRADQTLGPRHTIHSCARPIALLHHPPTCNVTEHCTPPRPAAALCPQSSSPQGDSVAALLLLLLLQMALRSAAAQAATLLRLRGARPASLWVPLARRFSATPFASDEVRPGLHYAESHEWVKVDGDVGTVGITDHAQKALGDLVFVELPEGGSPVTAAEKFGSVESVKAVSDIISPVSGEVLEFNATLTEAPETVNSDPYEAGWLIKVKLSDKSEVDKLMGHEKYAEFQDSDH